MAPSTILVVDDEPDLELLIRQKFRKQIRDGELHFAFATDGVEALEQIAQDEHIDLILSDINMPRMDGLTLLGHLGGLERLIKVVMISAYGDISNIRTAMNRGAFDFITKPIDFADLAATIQKTLRELQTLKQAAVAEAQLLTLRNELDIAAQIQLSVLPSTFPPYPERDEFDLYATMIPAREVGGDFYDFFFVDENHLGIVLGDVSGKGIGAAMFMAITRTILRATALQGLPPDLCLTHVNRVLFPESLSRMFVTLFYGVLDVRTGQLTYALAGHHPPYHLSSDGEVRVLERTGGIGLCLKADYSYQARHVSLAPGDTLLLYTDGVTEAVNLEREQFSEERLEAFLGEVCDEKPAPLLRDVLRALELFSEGTPQADDITLLSLLYNGTCPAHRGDGLATSTRAEA
ncbi:MAG: response regulator [Bacteroidetes bacterium]|nr:MAG: response regulator [Bacteroidota bacterium]